MVLQAKKNDKHCSSSLCFDVSRANEQQWTVASVIVGLFLFYKNERTTMSHTTACRHFAIGTSEKKTMMSNVVARCCSDVVLQGWNNDDEELRYSLSFWCGLIDVKKCDDKNYCVWFCKSEKMMTCSATTCRRANVVLALFCKHQ
jgi:hypothetical protein